MPTRRVFHSGTGSLRLMNDEVLIVDDCARDAYFLLRALNNSAPSIRWIFEQRPEDAMQRFVDGKGPALLVLDLLMPGIDGYDFYARLENEGLLNCPVVLISGGDGGDERMAALERGGAIFRNKPDTIAGYDELAQYLAAAWSKTGSEKRGNGGQSHPN